MSYPFDAAVPRYRPVRTILQPIRALVACLWASCAVHAVVAAAAPSSVAAPPAAAPALLADALLNTLRFVSWPEDAVDGEQFVLCYPADAAAAPSLAPLEGRPLQERRLQLRKLDTPARALGCQALFLPRGCAARERYIEAVALRPVLTIGDDVDALAFGANLALLRTAARLRPAVNTDALQRSGLRVDARLLRVARRQLPPGPPR